MPTKSTASSKKARRPPKNGGKSVGSSRTKSEVAMGKVEKNPDRSEEQFVRGVLIRGEAAKSGEQGELPPGATHRIVEDDKGSVPVIERDRFSLY